MQFCTSILYFEKYMLRDKEATEVEAEPKSHWTKNLLRIAYKNVLVQWNLDVSISHELLLVWMA